VLDHALPRGGPSITQRSGPAGSSTRAASHGRSSSPRSRHKAAGSSPRKAFDVRLLDTPQVQLARFEPFEPAHTTFVGRKQELAQLEDWWDLKISTARGVFKCLGWGPLDELEYPM
jgi:hypothetical protein